MNNKKNMDCIKIMLLLAGVILAIYIIYTSMCKEDMSGNREKFTFEVSNEREKCLENEVSHGKKGCCGGGHTGSKGHFEMNAGNWPNRPDVPMFKSDSKEKYANNDASGNDASGNDLKSAVKNLQLILFTMQGCGHCVSAKNSLQEKGLIDAVQIKDASESRSYSELSSVRGFPCWFSVATKKHILGNRPIDMVVAELSEKENFKQENNELSSRAKDIGLVLFTMQGCPHCVTAKNNIDKSGLNDSIKVLDAREIERYPSLKDEVRGFPCWYSEKNNDFVLGSKPINDVIERLSQSMNPPADASGNDASGNDASGNDASGNDMIVLYLQAGCPYCDAAQQHIEQQGLHDQVLMMDSAETQNLHPSVRQQITGFPAWVLDDNVSLGFSESRPFPIIRDALYAEKYKKEHYKEKAEDVQGPGPQMNRGDKLVALIDKAYMSINCPHSGMLKTKLGNEETTSNGSVYDNIEIVDVDAPNADVSGIEGVPTILGKNGEKVVGNRDLDEMVSLLEKDIEKFEPQYYKYGEYAKPNGRVVYPLQNSCGSNKVERYGDSNDDLVAMLHDSEQGAKRRKKRENFELSRGLDTGCRYRNPGGQVDIPSVG